MFDELEEDLNQNDIKLEFNAAPVSNIEDQLNRQQKITSNNDYDGVFEVEEDEEDIDYFDDDFF